MKIFGYNNKNGYIHNLSGITKLLVFLFFSLLGMLSYNTYVLGVMLIFSIVCIYLAKIEYKQVSFVIKIMMFFLILNTITIYLISPQEGVKIYGSMTKITNFGTRYDLTYQQLFYEFNIFLKYLVVAPLALIFITTTNPSELAAGLNKLGVPYTICYSISLAFRYIPDVQEEFKNIKKSKEARGIDLSNKVSLFKRIKNTVPILIPLIITSIDKIETISTAMELRNFGANKKRTWYAYKEMQTKDYIILVFLAVFFILGIYVTFKNGTRFLNPFV